MTKQETITMKLQAKYNLPYATYKELCMEAMKRQQDKIKSYKLFLKHSE